MGSGTFCAPSSFHVFDADVLNSNGLVVLVQLEGSVVQFPQSVVAMPLKAVHGHKLTSCAGLPSVIVKPWKDPWRPYLFTRQYIYFGGFFSGRKLTFLPVVH